MSDRLTIQALPCYEGAHPDAGPKRLSLAQGELALLHPACPEIRFLGFLGFKPGVPRGSHYHPDKTEFFYLLHGEIELRTLDRTTGASALHLLKPGDLTTIAPNVEHIYLPLTAAEAIEFSASPWRAEDTVRVKMD